MPRTPSSIVVLLFTDLVGSTELLEALGEDAGEQLRRTHFSMLRDVVNARGGQEVKSLGDGLMVVFTSAVDALGCAVAMQQAVQGHDQLRSRVRVGLHVGEPIQDEDDYFGMPVVTATRLCSSAQGGQILASDLVRRLVGSRGQYTFRDLGALQLKGIAEPLAACEVAWEPEVAAPPSRPTAVRAFRTILFTDIHASGVLFQQIGDDRAWLIKQTWARMTREAVEAHDGIIVKELGDGALASFLSATKAVECAVSIQGGFAAQKEAEETQTQVKIGLNAGEPIVSDDDIFGSAVYLAKRICDEAQPGQILVSEAVRQIVAGKEFLFADQGETALRGFEDPVHLYEVRWRD
ncbi:MAG: adenylate/guanylate cyclase domain-containing protein [Dehalococcoidia bacterium]